MTDRVQIFEVAARDGLQNEQQFVATADKIRLVNMMSECGFDKIEVTSFVSPKWVPQMADAADVMAGIVRKPGVTYAALTPNLKGLQRALAAGADEVAVFASASEAFSQKNINCSIDESLERFAPVMAGAAVAGVPVRGYVSCITDCPYEGKVMPRAVARVALALDRMGCYEVSLGDTIGHATPEMVIGLIDVVLEVLPAERLAGHFHDTQGRALDNILASLQKGIRTFDAALGGLGGCPYAPGASGNVDTLAVADLLVKQGFVTGIVPDKLVEAAAFAQALVGKQSPR